MAVSGSKITNISIKNQILYKTLLDLTSVENRKQILVPISLFKIVKGILSSYNYLTVWHCSVYRYLGGKQTLSPVIAEHESV
jgi:hypothetical protein